MTGCAVSNPLRPTIDPTRTVSSAELAIKALDVTTLAPEPAPPPPPQSDPPPIPTPSPVPPPPVQAPAPAPCAAPSGSIAPFIASPVLQGAASVVNAGTWELRLYANDHGGSIGATLKAKDIQLLACGQGRLLTVAYAWKGDPLEYWWLELRLNGKLIETSSITLANPYN